MVNHKNTLSKWYSHHTFLAFANFKILASVISNVTNRKNFQLVWVCKKFEHFHSFCSICQLQRVEEGLSVQRRRVRWVISIYLTFNQWCYQHKLEIFELFQRCLIKGNSLPLAQTPVIQCWGLLLLLFMHRQKRHTIIHYFIIW